MNNTFSLEIITFDKSLHYDDVVCIILRTTSGEISLLANHIDKISNIDITPLTIKFKDKEEHLALSSGVMDFNHKKNTAYLIVDTVEKAEDIDLARAKKRKIEAEELLSNPSSDIDTSKAERMLKMSINRINVKEEFSK